MPCCGRKGRCASTASRSLNAPTGGDWRDSDRRLTAGQWLADMHEYSATRVGANAWLNESRALRNPATAQSPRYADSSIAGFTTGSRSLTQQRSLKPAESFE